MQEGVKGMEFFAKLKNSYEDSKSIIYMIEILSILLILSALVIYLFHGSYIQAIAITIACVAIVLFFISVLGFHIRLHKKNIHKLQTLKAEIEQKENRFRAILNSFNDVFWEYNVETKSLSFSEKWTSLTGYENLVEYDFHDFVDNLVHPNDKQRLVNELTAYLNDKTPFFECNFRLKDSKNVYKWVYTKGGYQEGNGEANTLCGLISDITSRKNIEEKLNYMAYHDALTGLPNKGLFQNYLKEAVSNAVKNGTKGALVFLDIDDFKDVNDTLGHDYGDQLLKIISELLKVTLDNCNLVSRIGGDEFILLIENTRNKTEVADLCEKIIGLFKYPFEIGDKAIYSTVSIGATIFPDDSTELNSLFKNADTAMYRSKETGKNKYCFFDTNMAAELERKTKIGNLLREAVQKNELFIVYQPLYNMKTGKIVSMEALLRWDNPELGFIPPSEFIPVAESNGTITSIGRWVFEEVCKQNRVWKSKGYSYKSIAVNISTMQIQDEKFVSYISDAIKENGLDPGSIELEITETLLMSNIFFNEKKLHDVKKLGVKIAIDDFGTGYSSLNYLTYLPLDTLKIDKAFIDNITTISRDRILAENIIKLSHDLKINVVAEGVENREQLDILSNINCDIVQGYYFSKPLPKESIETKLAAYEDGGVSVGER